jgi:nitrite reductase/ring-hydroxylating ferredoxin subunit
MADQQAPPAGPDLSNGVPLSEFVSETLLGHVGEDEVLLVRSGSEIFAIGAHCSHYHGPLAEGLMVGVWQLNLIPVGNKAYFFLADTGEQSTRASVDEATRLFNITTYPTVIVTKLVPPMQGEPTAANLDIQVRCEGQPLPACTQQVLDWFGEN